MLAEKPAIFMKKYIAIILAMNLIAVAAFVLSSSYNSNDSLKEREVAIQEYNELIDDTFEIVEISKEPEDLIKELDIDENTANQIIKASNESGYPVWFLTAVANTESDFVCTANSRAGAKYGRGLCQISEIVLKEYNNYHEVKYTTNDLYDAGKNLEVSTWYFDQIKNRYFVDNPEDYTGMYMAYNVGPVYYSKHRKMLDNGQYYNFSTKEMQDYNAKNRFTKYADYYIAYFNN